MSKYTKEYYDYGKYLPDALPDDALRGHLIAEHAGDVDARKAVIEGLLRPIHRAIGRVAGFSPYGTDVMGNFVLYKFQSIISKIDPMRAIKAYVCKIAVRYARIERKRLELGLHLRGWNEDPSASDSSDGDESIGAFQRALYFAERYQCHLKEGMTPAEAYEAATADYSDSRYSTIPYAKRREKPQSMARLQSKIAELTSLVDHLFISLDAPVGDGKTTVSDSIADDTGSPEDKTIADVTRRIENDALVAGLLSLTDKERAVFLRIGGRTLVCDADGVYHVEYSDDTRVTTAELAREKKVTDEAIAKVYRRAVRKMKDFIENATECH